MNYFFGRYNFFQNVFFYDFIHILLKSAKLTFPSATSQKNIYETRDNNETFSILLFICAMFIVRLDAALGHLACLAVALDG